MLATGNGAGAVAALAAADDLDMLAYVLEGGLDSAGGRLDLHTGQAWPETVLTDAWAEDQEDDLDEAPYRAHRVLCHQ